MKGSFVKKCISAYAILLVILLLILITGGIPSGIIIDVHDHLGNADGSKFEKIFLVYNFVVILLCLITSIVITCMKANQIHFKWIIPVILLVLSITFLPLVRISSIGGITGRPYTAHQSFIASFFE